MSKQTLTDFNLLSQHLSLKNVSKILGVPSSTLRYWEKEGLVAFSRNWQNDYRQISMTTLFTLLDIVELREMGVPIEKVRESSQMDWAEHLALMVQSQTALEEKIAALQKTIAKIELKKQQLHRLHRLQNQPPTLVTKQMPAIYTVNLLDTDESKRYLNPFQGADVLYFDDPDSWHLGMLTPNKSGELRHPPDEAPQLYLNGLFYIGRDNSHNGDELLAHAEQLGYQPQYMISQFLAFAQNETGGLTDYYECWIALGEMEKTE